MSIEEQSIEVITQETAPAPGSTQQIEKRAGLREALRTPDLYILGICLLAAFLIRVWLVLRTNGVIDGDEVLVGVQAEHILRGELPIYFYGQPYMGSLEAYLVAIFIAIGGPSALMLRAEPILMSLVVVWLTWKLAAALADTAHLPLYARRTFMTVAALIAAIPPLYDGILELRTYGGYSETFVLMLLLLFAALQLTRRWRAGASRRALTLRWAGMGFLVGLGFWIYPLLISAVLATAIWIVGDRVATMGQWVRANARRAAAGDHKRPAHYPLDGLTQHQGNRKGPSTTLHHPLPLHSAPLLHLLPALAAIPAALLGFAPALSWGATHQWQNITYVLGLGGSATGHSLSTIKKVTRSYVTCVAPRVISGAVPKESTPLSLVHSPLLITGVVCIFAVAGLVAASFLWPNPAFMRIRQLAAFPALFAACTAFIFCISKASIYVVISCNYDIAGRYATPLVLALPFFFATAFTMMSMYRGGQGEVKTGVEEETRQSQKGDGTGGVNQGVINHAPTKVGTWSALLQAILLISLLAYLGAQAWTYGLTDPGRTFQSAYCLEAPARNEPIIAYLQQEHVHYAWASNWLAYGIVFKTDGAIIAADPMALFPHSPNLDRIPANTEAVRHADRPTLLIFVHHNDAHPLLLRYLDERQVTYRSARFPSQPGIDVLVVTPLSRTVSPFESPVFQNIFMSCND